MMKRVDNAVYQAMTDGPEMETGFNVMGVANGGISFAMDDNNASLVTDAMRANAYEAALKIATGELMVHDYMSDDSCPALSF